jgi:hypothetical protein
MKTPDQEIFLSWGPEEQFCRLKLNQAGAEVHQVSVMASISSFSSRAINFLIASLGARPS